jgi:hypothetical protein
MAELPVLSAAPFDLGPQLLREACEMCALMALPIFVVLSFEGVRIVAMQQSMDWPSGRDHEADFVDAKRESQLKTAHVDVVMDRHASFHAPPVRGFVAVEGLHVTQDPTSQRAPVSCFITAVAPDDDAPDRNVHASRLREGPPIATK